MVSIMCFDWIFVFFFKQKTAYEMRISDWSSDVCSSDLFDASAPVLRKPSWIRVRLPSGNAVQNLKAKLRENRRVTVCEEARSEEHTSELQSPMRISYAVFCLKKTSLQTISKSDHHTYLLRHHMHNLSSQYYCKQT